MQPSKIEFIKRVNVPGFACIVKESISFKLMGSLVVTIILFQNKDIT
jgi:hypothetical protein